jgi:uncharacterized protein YqeY
VSGALYGRLESDLVQARKDRDATRLATLGVLKSEVVTAGKEPGAAGSTDDALVLRVVRKELKQRQEAAEAYAAAGRERQAQEERAKAEVLASYLPAQLSDEELERELAAVIADVKPEGPKDFGAVMKAASARLGGRAEGGRISAAARRLLAG